MVLAVVIVVGVVVAVGAVVILLDVAQLYLVVQHQEFQECPIQNLIQLLNNVISVIKLLMILVLLIINYTF